MVAVECKNVTKKFKDENLQEKVALDNVSFKMKENKIYALLGRNGAGKTTLLNCLCTKYLPDTGEIYVLGEKVYENEKVLKQICFMSDNLASFEIKNVKKILQFASTFYENWDENFMERLLEFFEIDKGTLYNALSKGQKTVIGIIIGLCSNCKVVFLDEIYSGLDAVARKNFYNILLEAYENNPRTFVLSTHLIEEMTGLFTDVIIMDKGKILLNEDMEVIHQKSYKCVGRTDLEGILKGKNVIGKTQIGATTEYAVYDEFTAEEMKRLKDNNFTV